MSHPPFSRLAEDALRCWAPERLPDFARLLAQAGRGGEAALARTLERDLGIPGYFSGGYALHFASRFFDAHAALYDAHFVPPEPAAAPFDNVHKAQALVGDAAIATGRLHSREVDQADADRLVRRAARNVPPLDALSAAAAAASEPLAALLPAQRERAFVRILCTAPDAGPPVVVRGRLVCFDADGNLLVQDPQSDTRLTTLSGGALLKEGAAACDAAPFSVSPRLTLFMGSSVVAVTRE